MSEGIVALFWRRHQADIVVMVVMIREVFSARMNNHSFADGREEDDALIYNWNPVFSKNTVYDQIYIFPLDTK